MNWEGRSGKYLEACGFHSFVFDDFKQLAHAAVGE